MEDELRAMLNGVSGANLIRRQRIVLISAKAFTIGSQLARDPDNAVLVPHVLEIKRLKSFSRRKKAAQAPGSPTSPARRRRRRPRSRSRGVPERPAVSKCDCDVSE